MSITGSYTPSYFKFHHHIGAPLDVDFFFLCADDNTRDRFAGNVTTNFFTREITKLQIWILHLVHLGFHLKWCKRWDFKNEKFNLRSFNSGIIFKTELEFNFIERKIKFLKLWKSVRKRMSNTIWILKHITLTTWYRNMRDLIRASWNILVSRDISSIRS